MALNVPFEVSRLQRMTPNQLRERYAELYGEATNSRNKVWLVKRIAWRMQALDEGDLSERARERAAELARDADLRTTPPKGLPVAAPGANKRTQTETVTFRHDGRLPPPGTILTRKYKGEDLEVKVLTTGFEYDGEVYTSLSAVAKAITGSHCNGYLFFRLEGLGAKV